MSSVTSLLFYGWNKEEEDAQDKQDRGQPHGDDDPEIGGSNRILRKEFWCFRFCHRGVLPNWIDGYRTGDINLF